VEVESPRSRCQQGWFHSEVTLHGLQMATFSLCPHMFLPVCTPLAFLSAEISSFHKDTSMTGLGPTLTTLTLILSPLLRCCLQTLEFKDLTHELEGTEY
jgi:hypothetical protein